MASLVRTFKAPITFMLIRGKHSHAQNTKEEELYHSPTINLDVCGRPCKCVCPWTEGVFDSLSPVWEFVFLIRHIAM